MFRRVRSFRPVMGMGNRVGWVCVFAAWMAACSGESSVDTGDDDSNGDDSGETGGSSSGGTASGGSSNSGGQSNGSGGNSGARAKISLTLKKVTP